MDGHSWKTSIARTGSEGTSPFLHDAQGIRFRELYLGLKVTASFDRSESYTRVIDGQMHHARSQAAEFAGHLERAVYHSFRAWMIPPVYHSLRRESIKTASSASPIGVQSVRPTWFQDTTPKDTAPQPNQDP